MEGCTFSTASAAARHSEPIRLPNARRVDRYRGRRMLRSPPARDAPAAALQTTVVIRMFQKIIASAMNSPIYRNRYYGMGLSLQKGLPVVLIPVLVFVFGKSTYAQYILFFSVVQVYAALTSVGVPQSVVPLWFRQHRHDEFFASVVFLVLGLGLVFAPLGLAVLRAFAAPKIHDGARDLLAVAIISFALLYNFGALATAAARARDQQRLFFWSIVAGAVALTGVILGAYAAGRTSLYGLIVAQALTYIVSVIVITWKDVSGLFSFRRSTIFLQTRQVFVASIPVYAYTLTTMYIMVADKWVVKIFFPGHLFFDYVINYQFAFSILFVPTTIVFYLGPRFSQLASLGLHEEIARLEIRARRMALSLSALLSVAICIYGAITGVKVTAYYWLLVAGFLVHGLQMIMSSRFMGYLHFNSMFAVNLISAGVFTTSLILAVFTRQVLFVYVTWILYSGTALALSALVARNRNVAPAGRTPTIEP